MISRESVFGNHIEERSHTRMPRRAFVAGMSGALALVASPGRLVAEDRERPHDPFIVLLRGSYQPVVHGPDLGLSSVNLSDGTYSRTRIYPVFGIDGDDERGDSNKAIGTFYVQFAGDLCAYDLPGGAIAMQFQPPPNGAPPGFNGFVPFPDGKGGQFLEGTYELTILHATGVYRAFRNGHNHMVDRLHHQADGRFNEFCFCNISTYPFP